MREHTPSRSDATEIVLVAPARGAWRVILRGDVDLAQVSRLGETLDHALGAVDDVRVDVAGLRAIDSTGMRELLKAQAVAARSGKRFVVLRPPAEVLRLFRAADVGDLFSES